jgi:hypothetical protein
MNRNILLKIGGFLILALAMLSCTNTNLSPVFYAVEHEKSLVDDRGFPDDAVVMRIIQNGTANYFAAALTLYTRTAGGGTWSSISPPVAGALCTNVEIFSGQLVAAFMLPDNTGGLFYRPVDLSTPWVQVSGLPAGAQIGLLRNTGTELFVSTLSSGTYGLYHSTALPTLTATNLTATMTTGPISDVALAGTTYWATVGSTLYSSADIFNTFAADSTVSTNGAFDGLFLSSGGTLYLAADGKFYTNPGTGWVASSSITVEGNSVQFTTFVETSGLPGSHVYAGTGGYGYYDTSTLERLPFYTISALYDGAILSMLYDGSGATPVLLLGTYNSGLWRGDWDGANWQWKQE